MTPTDSAGDESKPQQVLAVQLSAAVHADSRTTTVPGHPVAPNLHRTAARVSLAHKPLLVQVLQQTPHSWL